MKMTYQSGSASLIMALIIFGIAAGPGVADESGSAQKGPEMIQLDGGMLGSVPFPHRMHQGVAEQCNTCHNMFPQEPGAIKSLQASGDLKKQQVMNGLCIDCHTDRQSAGEASGPIQCGKCHQR